MHRVESIAKPAGPAWLDRVFGCVPWGTGREFRMPTIVIAQVIGRQPATLQLRYLQTLTEIAAEKNSTIVFPLPLELLEGFFKGGNQSSANGGINRNVPGAQTPA